MGNDPERCSMTFAEQLKAHRQRLGLTQSEAAALLDVPDRTYWELAWNYGRPFFLRSGVRFRSRRALSVISSVH